MHKLILSAVGLVSVLCLAPGAEAACSGGVGSTSLSCSSTDGTLSDYKTFIQNDYVPAAISVVMQSFATVATSGMTGWGQVYDTWGHSKSVSTATYQYNVPSVGGKTLPTVIIDKAAAPFLIDGKAPDNAANAYVDVYWTGTIAQVVNGVTNYIASYDFKVSAGAWSSTGLTGSYPNYTGSGTYNLTAAVTPVPGPEAGAGVGALAIGAMAVYLKRRGRKAQGPAASPSASL